MSEYVSQGSCPKCNRERFALYSDGSQHCHKCDHHVFPDGNTKETPKLVSKNLIELEYHPLGSRKISQATCEKYGYGIGDFKGEPTQAATYADKDGNVVAQKFRLRNKDFSWIGDPKAASLFGQDKFTPNPKLHIVVTEGEIDALSLYEVNGGYPVVSIKNGADSAAKEIAQQLEYLEGFKEVIFMFDMDDPGIKAANECVQVLQYGKAKIAKLPLKDANDMLRAGRVKELIQAQWDAKPWKPKGILTAGDVAEAAKKPVEWGLSWPWESLTQATYGCRYGEVYGWGAGTGVGKTTAVFQVATHMAMVHGDSVGLIPLENDPSDSLKRVAGVHAQKILHTPDSKATQEELYEAIDVIVDAQKFFLAGDFERQDWDEVKSRSRFLVKAHGVKHIFLDNLTALVSAEDDKNKAIEKIMGEMARLAKELNICFHYVSHLTTPESGSHEEGARVVLKHFRGSRAIGFWSHFVFAFERDTQDTEKRNECLGRILKDRYTGKATGLTFGLEYSHETGLLSEAKVFAQVEEY